MFPTVRDSSGRCRSSTLCCAGSHFVSMRIRSNQNPSPRALRILDLSLEKSVPTSDAISYQRSAMLTSAGVDRYSIFRGGEAVSIVLFPVAMPEGSPLPQIFLLHRLLRCFSRTTLDLTGARHPANDVLWPRLRLLVNSADVLPNHAQEEEHDAGQKRDRDNEGCKSLR